MMNSSNPFENKEASKVLKSEEPKSAHATPVVEKYIKKRNLKAEKQIQHEENGKSS